MKITLKKFALAAAMVCGASVASASPVFVGQWDLYSGVAWNNFTAPTSSGQSAAAVLFGGVASDYVISTIDSTVANIDHMAWLDQIYVGVGKFSESYLVDAGVIGIYDNAGDTAAQVLDNAAGQNRINYAFRVDSNAVPEPGSIALIGLGLAGLAAVRRRRSA